MTIEAATPATRLRAILLLPLAHTLHYLQTARRLRKHHGNTRSGAHRGVASPVASLRNRLHLIRGLLVFGMVGLIAGKAAMLIAANDAWAMARPTLTAGLLFPVMMLLTALLALALREISLSLAALDAEHARLPCA